MQENLLSNLNYASRLIHKTSDLMQKIAQLEKQFKKKKLYFKETPRHILYAFLIILFSGIIIDLTPINFPVRVIVGNIFGSGMLAYLFLYAIPGGIVFYFLLKYMNKQCDKENQKINQYNENLKKKIEPILQELSKVQSEYAQNCASWYPKNYCCVAAVDSFVYNVSNYRADNLKEAINLYEEELHRRRMESSQEKILNNQNAMMNNQKQMINQQNYANILAEASLDEQRNTNERLEDIKNRIQDVRIDVHVHK